MIKGPHHSHSESPLDKADYNTVYPEFLKGKKRWLLFKLGTKDARGKQPKYPYYLNGTMRKGGQGSEADLKKSKSMESILHKSNEF